MTTAAAIIRARTLRDELVTRRCEHDLRVYAREAWAHLGLEGGYEHNWHLDAFADHLMGVTVGHITRLAITVPQRFLKSTFFSILWPSWEWGPHNRPTLRKIYASHGMSLSVRDSVACRRLIDSEWYAKRWGHRFALTTDQNVKTRFENDKGGFRHATSFESDITGHGGHHVCVDDPHDTKDADNPDAIKRNVSIFTGTLTSRLDDRRIGAIVVVQQRVAPRDVAGVCIADGYVHLNLRSEYDPKRSTVTVGSVRPRVDTLEREGKRVDVVHYDAQTFRDPRTQTGELLFPSRVGPAEIAKMRGPAELGERKYQAFWNQDPKTSTGTLFPREGWKFWTLLPAKFDDLTISVDCAFKGTADSDHVVMQIWGRRRGEFWLVHQVRGQMGFTATETALRNLCALYPHAYRKLVEDKANGTAVIERLRSEISGLVPIEPDGGKWARANAIQPYHEAGNIYLPRYDRREDGQPAARVFVPMLDADGHVETDENGAIVMTDRGYDASWVPGFVEECADFTGAAGNPDDQVDAMTQYINYMQRAGAPSVSRLGKKTDDKPTQETDAHAA